MSSTESMMGRLRTIAPAAGASPTCSIQPNRSRAYEGLVRQISFSSTPIVYRGQLDDSRPRRKDFGNDEPVTGRDLRAAMNAVIAGKRSHSEQRTSIGCNIKWREE
jgi:hypothetical protein